MSLAKKYGISEAIITNMYRNGDLPQGVINRYKIYDFFRSTKESGQSHSEAVKLTADQFDVTTSYVYEVIKKMVDG
jgi:hypothetical protein